MNDEQPEGGGITVSHLFGEMTWLMSQSPLHRLLPIQELERLIMPPILLRQLFVFRDGTKPIGFATWAYCNAAAEKKLNKGLLDPKAGFGPDDWKSGETCWLVDFVAPFANAQNRHREIMLADLVSGPLENTPIRMHRTDPKTGERSVVDIGKDAGEKLKEAILAAAAEEVKH